jgi:hypothetical protein
MIKNFYSIASTQIIVFHRIIPRCLDHKQPRATWDLTEHIDRRIERNVRPFSIPLRGEIRKPKKGEIKMSKKQKKCAGCDKLFPENELTEEERTRNGKPAGTFFWCEPCLLKELDNWEKESGKKEVHIKLGD